jgi:hypothetical protein
MGASLIASLIASLMAASLIASLMAASLIASLMAALITTPTMYAYASFLMMHFDPIVSGLRGKRSWTVASPGAATHATNHASKCVSKMGTGCICAACNGLYNLVAGIAQR